MVNMPEIPSSKTLAFVFLGVILYLGSLYLNNLESDFSTIGASFGLGLIIIGTIVQILHWIQYFRKKYKESS